MPVSSKTPLYQRVATSLRRAIDSGRYRPGDRLPDERRLAVEQKVSRATIRQALKTLADSRRIERVQGSGTYISQLPTKASYVQVIAVGPTSRYSHYVASVIGEAERSAARRDLRLSVRYLESRADLPGAILAVEGDSTVIGGMLVGYVAEADVQAACATNTPWVMLGDFTDTVRRAPVIDQVCGDGYAWAEAAVKCLLSQGVRRPALLTYEAGGVWTQDRISAFRALGDVAGIPASDQHIRALVDEGLRESDSVEHFHRALRAGILTTVRHWLSVRNPPDGILLPGPVLPDWLDIVRNLPEAAPLREARIVAMDFDQKRRMIQVPGNGQPIWWAVMSMSDITDRALERLLETPRDRHAPIRDYIREVTVIPHEAGSMASSPDILPDARR